MNVSVIALCSGRLMIFSDLMKEHPIVLYCELIDVGVMCSLLWLYLVFPVYTYKYLSLV